MKAPNPGKYFVLLILFQGLTHFVVAQTEILYPDTLQINDSLPPSTVEIELPPRDYAWAITKQTLRWKKPYSRSPVQYYGLQIAKGDSSNIIYTENVNAPNWYTPMFLQENNVYYWRVRAKNKYGYNQYCNWAKFSIPASILNLRAIEVTVPYLTSIKHAIEQPTGVFHIWGNRGFCCSTDSGATWFLPGSDYFPLYTMKGPFRWDKKKQELYAFGFSKHYIYYDSNNRQWKTGYFDYDQASANNIAWVDNFTALMATSQGLYLKTGYYEWRRIYYAPYSGGLMEIVVKGSDTVVAAGANGLVVVSTDGGWTYQRKYLPADQNFISSGITKDGSIILWSAYGTKFTSSDLFNTWEEEFQHVPGEFSSAQYSNGYELTLTRTGNLATKYEGSGSYFYDAGRGEIASQSTFRVNSEGKVALPASGTYILSGQLPHTPTEVEEESTGSLTFGLGHNYPNPFNSATVIPCSIDLEGMYTLEVFNMLGSKVYTLFEGFLQAGNHKFKLSSDTISSGVYLVSLSNSKGKRVTSKVIVLK